MIQINRWQLLSVFLFLAFAVLFALPNFLSTKQINNLPNFFPKDKISLGLDLRGGVHLLLKADVEVIKSDYITSLSEDFSTNLRDSKIRAKRLKSESNEVLYRLASTSNIDKTKEKLEEMFSNSGSYNKPDYDVSDEGLISLTVSKEQLKALVDKAMEQSIEVVNRRVNALGLSEAVVARQGVARIQVQVPGLDNPDKLKAIIGKTARLTFHLVSEKQPRKPNDRPPAGLVAFEMVEGGSSLWVNRKAEITGNHLVNASTALDSNYQPSVSFTLNSSGAEKFAKFSSANVGRAFATVLDDKVITAPVIREAITGGSGQISGSFTSEEASDLALLLRAGALPTKLVVVQESVVGPGLGSDSIAAGELASLVSYVVVLIFMIVVYRLFGLVACVSLLFNMIMLIAGLSFLQAVLTLPGIAGIVLTIGMAVDANVLIFEHIKEELKADKSPLVAIESGFNSAQDPIIDANITTLIAGLILFWFGSGPVRGFAVTLTLGTLTSVFTAFMVTRVILAIWVLRFRPSKLMI